MPWKIYYGKRTMSHKILIQSLTKTPHIYEKVNGKNSPDINLHIQTFLQRTIVTPPVGTQLKDLKPRVSMTPWLPLVQMFCAFQTFFHCFVYFFTWFLCTAVYIPFLYKHTKTISSYMWTNGFCLSLRRYTFVVPQASRTSYKLHRGTWNVVYPYFNFFLQN